MNAYRIRRPYARRNATRGFALAMVIAAISIIGVVATASYTIFGNQLMSMNRVSREDLNLNLIRTAARVLASLASDTDGDTTIELPAFLTGSGPTGGGVLPLDFPGNRADAWGTLLGYCTWDNGTTNTSVNRLTGTVANPEVATIMAIVSAGPNKTFETTCADAAANTTRGDDLIMKATTAEATTGIGGESVWTKHSETMISFGEASPGVARVGVGTATPSKALVVHTQTSTDGVRVENATNPIAEIAGTSVSNDAGQMTLYNAGTARVRLNASGPSYLMGGSLGIGLNNPTNALEIGINQASGSGALISNTDAGASAASYVTETTNAGTTSLRTTSIAGGNLASLSTSAPTLNIGSSNASGTINLQTAGSTRITLNQSGNIGIGVAPSATSKFHLQTDTTIGTAAVFHNNRTTGAGHAIYAITNAPDGWGIYGDGPSASAGSFSGGGVFGTSASGMGVRGISNTHIAIQGTSTSSWGGHFISYNGSAAYAETNIAGAASLVSYNPSCAYSYVGYSGYGFHTPCAMYSGGGYQGSDRRLKDNITPITGATSIIKRLNPVEFDWRANSDQYRTGHRHDMGLIAQEAMEVLPTIVREIPAPKPPIGTAVPGGQLPKSEPTLNQELGSFYAVEYTRIIPYLIKALQEQTERNDKLEARIAAIEKSLGVKP